MAEVLPYQNYIEEKFRLHILRFWSRERQIKFCLHILGDEAQLWWANKNNAQQSVQRTCFYCDENKEPAKEVICQDCVYLLSDASR